MKLKCFSSRKFHSLLIQSFKLLWLGLDTAKPCLVETSLIWSHLINRTETCTKWLLLFNQPMEDGLLIKYACMLLLLIKVLTWKTKMLLINLEVLMELPRSMNAAIKVMLLLLREVVLNWIACKVSTMQQCLQITTVMALLTDGLLSGYHKRNVAVIQVLMHTELPLMQPVTKIKMVLWEMLHQIAKLVHLNTNLKGRKDVLIFICHSDKSWKLLVHT